MGKLALWRKHSYVRVQQDNPGCVWTVFRVLSYNRWYNLKKMLPYRKQKSHDHKSSQSKVNPNDEYQINDVNEAEGYDALMFDSASVNSCSSRALSTLIAKEDKSEICEEDQAELSPSTMLSLFKADPKLDSPRKRGLSRSGTFPSPNTLRTLGFGTTPSKVENKHTEIWPVMNHGYELRKAKSLRVRRSSSLNEINFDKFGNFLDTDSKKEIKKFPSLSEKEFSSLGDHDHPHLLRKCFSARVSLLENESYYSCMGGLRVDLPRDFDSPKHTEKSNETKLDGNWVSFVDEKELRNSQEHVLVEEEKSDDMTSENAENPRPVEGVVAVLEMSSTSPCENAQNAQPSNNTFTDSLGKEELEYVKHVLDVLGFVGGEITGESLDEALDPQLFDEIEVLCPFKTTKDRAGMSRLDRKVLFHLIIEALVDMHEKLFAYYAPNSSAFSCHIRAMTMGKGRIVEEVWMFASKYLNMRPEFDPRLDLAMALDMAKTSSSWNNPQMETEYVGLDLEELIFHDLLDDILSS